VNTSTKISIQTEHYPNLILEMVDTCRMELIPQNNKKQTNTVKLSRSVPVTNTTARNRDLVSFYSGFDKRDVLGGNLSASRKTTNLTEFGLKFTLN
jgi:hypothetical protein